MPPVTTARKARALGAGGCGDAVDQADRMPGSGSLQPAATRHPARPAVADSGTTATPKPSPTKRTTASEVANSNAIVRVTPARANAAST